jgi:antitoxin component YwqK of YwqJK toxin-antitoxin module
MLFISLLSPPSWSETMDDLVKRGGLYYKQFTDVPFTGKVTGIEQGSIKDGKRDGAWIAYRENGQLYLKSYWKNFKQEGDWIGYYENGQFWFKTNYKNGKPEGASVFYHKNGQLGSKGNWKNGEQEGAWIAYRENGTVDKEKTGTFKNGKKISD